MNKNGRLFFPIAVVSLLVINVISLAALAAFERSHHAMDMRLFALTSIKGKMETVDADLWSIISGYDPAKGTKPDFLSGVHNALMADIKTTVSDAFDAVTTDDLVLKFQILDRAVKSLDSRVSELQVLDINKKMFSGDTFDMGESYAAGTAVSYTDASVAQMEKIRLTMKVVNTAIQDCIAAETADIALKNQTTEKKILAWIVFCGLVSIGLVVGFMFYFRKTSPGSAAQPQ
jgi:hypothetical protein